MYKFEIESVYEDFYGNKELVDFSNYSTGPKFNVKTNNLIVGRIKDEAFDVSMKVL